MSPPRNGSQASIWSSLPNCGVGRSHRLPSWFLYFLDWPRTWGRYIGYGSEAPLMGTISLMSIPNNRTHQQAGRLYLNKIGTRIWAIAGKVIFGLSCTSSTTHPMIQHLDHRTSTGMISVFPCRKQVRRCDKKIWIWPIDPSRIRTWRALGYRSTHCLPAFCRETLDFAVEVASLKGELPYLCTSSPSHHFNWVPVPSICMSNLFGTHRLYFCWEFARQSSD